MGENKGYFFISYHHRFGIVHLGRGHSRFFIYKNQRKNFWKKEEKPKEEVLLESILFENEQYKIILESISFEDENREFFLEMDNEGLEVYQLVDKKSKSPLGGIYITEFYAIFETELWLQKVFVENNQADSHLISFNLKTAEKSFITKVGNYILTDYDLKKKIISGYNDEDYIKIELE